MKEIDQKFEEYLALKKELEPLTKNVSTKRKELGESEVLLKQLKKKLPPLEKSLEKFLTEEIRNQRAILTKANRHLNKESDLVAAYNLIKNSGLSKTERPIHPPYQNLCLIIDSSGSLADDRFVAKDRFESIKAGVKDAFEIGLEEDYVKNYAIINFSDKTLYSGWIPKKDYSKLLKQDILIFQGGGTSLDINTVIRMANSEKNFALLLVTDGFIYNCHEVERVFKEITAKGNRCGVVCLAGDFYDDDFFRTRVDKFADIYYFTKNEDEIKAGIRQYARLSLLQNHRNHYLNTQLKHTTP